VADPASRFDLKWISLGGQSSIPHEPRYGNHNGGDLAFGTDGYLYIGMGDGGSGNDPNNRAQDPTTLLGKMLRIDVSVPDGNINGYQVPTDNPFVDNMPIAANTEIWDFGMRNPWRFSFDIGPGGTGALLIADVGQGAIEEINYEPAAPLGGGRNYGWRIMEGTRTNITSAPAAFLPLMNPIYEYPHPDGFVVTGGFVYRGAALNPVYRGRYFFADFATARVWSIGLSVNVTTGEAMVANVLEHTQELGGPGAIGAVSSFGRDADGEMYIVQYSGTIMKLVPVVDARAMWTADFNNDGRPDLLTQSASGRVLLALNTGTNFDQILPVYNDVTTWRVVDFKDYNGDGRPDVLWQSPSGSVVEWIMDALGQHVTLVPYAGISEWRVAASGDIDHLLSRDLIWQAPIGRVVSWLMSGINLVGAQEIWGFQSDWRVVGTGDFDGDGDTDVLWQGPTGAVVVWMMHGSLRSSAQFVYNGASSWQVVSVGDLDGDGRPDILWRLPATGQFVVWFMNGTTQTQVRYVIPLGSGWQLSTTP
jgi:Glucose / Sorbosone dehydrogenase/FG-GAP-like repeat